MLEIDEYPSVLVLVDSDSKFLPLTATDKMWMGLQFGKTRKKSINPMK